MSYRERYAYPAASATTFVYFVHGCGDHAGRYLEYAEYLNNNGISFYAHDLQGMGKSGPVHGMMAHCERFDDYVDEVINEIQLVKSKWPRYKKVVLLGHSMGGLVAFKVSNRIQVTGLVLSSPLLQLNKKSDPLNLTTMLPSLAYLLPNLYIPLNFTKPEWFSQDPAVQAETQQDTYMWQYCARFGHALKILDATEKSRALWKYHYTRTVIFHSPNDMVTDIAGSRALLAARPDIVALHEVEGACHGLLKDKPEVRRHVYSEVLKAIQSFD